MTILAAVATGIVTQLLVGLAAYHNGRRHGRIRLPAALLLELREHKVHCIGEPRERVDLEIALLCNADVRPT